MEVKGLVVRYILRAFAISYKLQLYVNIISVLFLYFKPVHPSNDSLDRKRSFKYFCLLCLYVEKIKSVNIGVNMVLYT